MKKYNFIVSSVFLAFFCIEMTGTLHAQGSAHSSKLSGEQAVLFSKISEELMCQCGCNLVLGQCGHVNCPSAIPMREKLEEMILEKKSETEIMSFFVNDYTFRGKGPFGKRILSQPDTKGFDLMAWVMPFLAFAVFTAVLFAVVRRVTSGKKNTDLNPDVSPVPSDINRRIEDELKKLE